MALVKANNSIPDFTAVMPLCTNQTGNGFSQNIIDRGGNRMTAMLSLKAAVGASPTVTVHVLGSMDAVDYYMVPYAELVDPTNLTTDPIVVNAAGTVHHVMWEDCPWRYMKLNLVGNNNVTLTATVSV